MSNESAGSPSSRQLRAFLARPLTECGRGRIAVSDGRAEIFFHPQCFMSHGHFAGDDETRARAFLEIANDDTTDAVWFAAAVTAMPHERR